ncbi:MAG: tyrosine-type recombinase/integrase [Mycobacteriales bacterium]
MKRRRAAGAGSVDQLPSRRWRARYRAPDGQLRSAPCTFDSKLDAAAWLAGRGREEVEAARLDPAFAAFAREWLDRRQNLTPRTRAEYSRMLDQRLAPAFGARRLSAVTSREVRAWHAGLDPATPTANANVYGLLRTIFGSAVEQEVLPSSPCRIRGAGRSSRRSVTRPATLAELALACAAMPPRRRAMPLLAAWSGLRFGELAELRRKDLDLSALTVTVERAVVRVDGAFVVGRPKSAAGVRRVTLPELMRPPLLAHLSAYAALGPDALLFPAEQGGHLSSGTVTKDWARAREVAGRPDLRWHDLRHTGATLAAQSGATLAELQARLGHSTVQAALVYQHAAEGRDALLAARMNEAAARDTPGFVV